VIEGIRRGGEGKDKEIRDEQSTNHEQWIVKMRTLYDDRGIAASRRHPVALESLGESTGNYKIDNSNVASTAWFDARSIG